ncbi:VOC domain-containing protein [Citrus sinensis]|nr:VOC domain-containing protein [Citrus sinensis]
MERLSSTVSYSNTMPILSLNHVSFVCKSVKRSVMFYEQVLGFVIIKRPSFNFEGAWLFNHGIGIHLLESDKAPEKRGKINPKDNHISFQCSDMKLYETAVVEEGGIRVDQLFFHDPDGYMIEICNCQNLPVLPLSSCPLKLPSASANANANARHTKSTIYGNVLFSPRLSSFSAMLLLLFSF